MILAGGISPKAIAAPCSGRKAPQKVIPGHSLVAPSAAIPPKDPKAIGGVRRKSWLSARPANSRWMSTLVLVGALASGPVLAMDGWIGNADGRRLLWQEPWRCDRRGWPGEQGSRHVRGPNPGRAIRAKVPEGVTSGTETRWAAGNFDKTEEIRALLAALYPTCQTPVRPMEHLVNEGLRMVAARVRSDAVGPTELMDQLPSELRRDYAISITTRAPSDKERSSWAWSASKTGTDRFLRASYHYDTLERANAFRIIPGPVTSLQCRYARGHPGSSRTL